VPGILFQEGEGFTYIPPLLFLSIAFFAEAKILGSDLTQEIRRCTGSISDMQ